MDAMSCKYVLKIKRTPESIAAGGKPDQQMIPPSAAAAGSSHRGQRELASKPHSVMICDHMDPSSGGCGHGA